MRVISQPSSIPGRLGKEEALRRIEPASNPYHIGTAEAQAWQYGLIEGKAKRLKVVHD